MTYRRPPPSAAVRTPPGPSWRDTPSLVRDLLTDRLGLLSRAAADYGDAVLIPVGPKRLYLFNHPDFAKHVLADNSSNYHKGIGLSHARRALGDGLLTSDGESWRRQRRTVRPVFSPARIAAQASSVTEEAMSLVARLRERTGGEPVDVVAEMTDLSLGVLGRTLLDADLGAYGHLGHAFEAVQDQAMFEMVTLNAVPSWLPVGGQLRFRRARRYLQGVVDDLVTQHSARHAGRPSGGDDVVSRLVAATAEDPDPAAAQARRRDELVTLLLAGHETTASTLGWSLYLLATHPEVFGRLHEEAVRVLGDGVPDGEDLKRLSYTTNVVEEVMRLYPPVWLLPRKALADDEIGGYHVPAGADVLVSPYTLHRHRSLWPEPDRFDPGRFDGSRKEGRPRYAYIPFGAGPRYCVGSSLGMMEAVVTLALLCRELCFELSPRRAVVPQPMLSLRLRGGLPMTVRVVR